MEPPKIATRLLAEEALRNQLHHLEETIGRLIPLKDSLEKGILRDRLLPEISALDSIADVMRQALDSLSSGDDIANELEKRRNTLRPE